MKKILIREYFTWKSTERILRIIEIIAIIGGVIFAAIQIRDVRSMQSAQLMLDFDKNLSEGTNYQIATAIDEKLPIFKENGGVFTKPDLEKYLGAFELIDAAYNARLITDDMLYDAFSSNVLQAHQNEEVKKYLIEIRKEDSDYYGGFEALYNSLKK